MVETWKLKIHCKQHVTIEQLEVGEYFAAQEYPYLKSSATECCRMSRPDRESLRSHYVSMASPFTFVANYEARPIKYLRLEKERGKV